MWLHLGPRPFVCHLASLWTLIISSAALLLLLRRSSHSFASSRLVCLPQPFSAGMHFLLQWLFTFSEHLFPQCSLRFILCHPHVCEPPVSLSFSKRTHRWQCAATMQREYSRRKLNECHLVEWLIIIWLRIWSTDTSSASVLLSWWGVIFF